MPFFLRIIINDNTVCHPQQFDQGLHCLPDAGLQYLLFSAVWSGSTLFAILSKRYYQGLHCMPFSAVSSGSTLLAILRSLIRFYSICHSQQSDQGPYYLPFSAVWSRTRSILSFSGTVWSGSTLYTILSILIRVDTICHSQHYDQSLHYLPFSAVWSGYTLIAILSSLIRVYTTCYSQQSDQGQGLQCSQAQTDQGLHYMTFSAVWPWSTLFAILSILIRIYTICHS